MYTLRPRPPGFATYQSTSSLKQPKLPHIMLGQYRLIGHAIYHIQMINILHCMCILPLTAILVASEAYDTMLLWPLNATI